MVWEVEEAAEWRQAGTPAAPTAVAAVVVAADVVVKGLECVAAQDVCEAHRASFCFAP